MNTKLLRTCLLIGSILSAIVLWITRTEYFPSLSSFANANNQIFYYLCLLSSSWFFILNGAKRDNNLDYWVGFGMGTILLTNMYIMPMAHNIATGLTLGLAIFNIIYETSKKERIVNIFLGIGAIGVFCIGYFTPFNFLFAEVIAMACIAIGMIRGIWIKEDESFELHLQDFFEKGDVLMSSDGTDLLILDTPRKTYKVKRI